jgi:hypothetical protein
VTWISRRTGKYCLHPRPARREGIDTMGAMYFRCDDCEKALILDWLSPELAEALRRAAGVGPGEGAEWQEDRGPRVDW